MTGVLVAPGTTAGRRRVSVGTWGAAAAVLRVAVGTSGAAAAMPRLAAHPASRLTTGSGA
ncbi:hypothetical protein ACFWN2_23420 [Lentzea sp. NPDC058436]|uniref:hypothetical protein n=1 Tax=Lentzea sp. NPDC058436 TaxID=3346499 RepID=UPI0036568765